MKPTDIGEHRIRYLAKSAIREMDGSAFHQGSPVYLVFSNDGESFDTVTMAKPKMDVGTAGGDVGYELMAVPLGRPSQDMKYIVKPLGKKGGHYAN